MLKIYTAIFIVLACAQTAIAQTTPAKKDTAKKLNEVTVRGYLNEQPVISTPASVSVLTPAQLKLQPDNSLVSALNTVPGVRMEERSPGSYRLSIRGSLLRSPFGIRDVKLYYDEIPFTDAGGNSYLNVIDTRSVQGIEVLKGPDGSLFGANSGGVVLISPVNRYNDSSFVAGGINGGSYGLVHQNVAVQEHSGNNQLNIDQAYEHYDGYRQNSAMHRNFFQAVDKVRLADNDNLKILGLYSNLFYQTPGGLTLAQYNADPQLARLPTATVPGALQQHISITTNMLLGGLVNEYQISDQLRNVVSVFGTYVDFSNPFITNYEQRYEGTYGLRTYFELTSKPQSALKWKADLGLEWQQTNTDDNNYGNRAGKRDTAQTLDKIHTNQHFFFGRYSVDITRRLHVEAAASVDFYGYKFRNVYPLDQSAFTNRDFSTQLMPRIAAAYQITNDFTWRASVSKGYSTPTTAEIRPTDNIINTALEPEHGWNYETGFRLRNSDETTYLDASVFYYRLQNAIIMRLNPDETQYYINAGGTNQPGFELYFTSWIIRPNSGDFIRGLQLNESFTYSRFKFRDYNYGGINYSGNQLPGVPQDVVLTSVQVKLPENIYVFVQHNYTGRIALNDGNSLFAAHYNVLQAKAGWQLPIRSRLKMTLYAGADNILNEKYSLGDDLNAVGNRYFNAAAPRNYFAGIDARF